MLLKSQKQGSVVSTNSKSPPQFWFIAGPNGAGKSTWAELPENREMIGNIPILNPDHFVAPYATSPVSSVRAGKYVLEEINNLVAARKSFAVETTLSGSHYFRLAKKLKEKGWEIVAVFIGVKDEEVCIARVRERKRSGGHDVPLEDIVRRYQRSISHIPTLLTIATYMVVLDNSQNYVQLLEYYEGQRLISKDLPLWLSSVLAL